ncbi:hypothetical protein CHS0354_023150 [Potamilus streckersoni]|uniref:Uncharacterized protein n=1 Tax=Potamilus streckersoni TaxID=2493646 RepID=A0AAE0VH31_9BIVA|nr:hypothetical protein CHS0354_023150 [Potamilus streckersoni]
MRTLAIYLLLLVVCTVTLSAELGKRSSDTDDAAIMEVLRNAFRRERQNVDDILETDTAKGNWKGVKIVW